MRNSVKDAAPHFFGACFQQKMKVYVAAIRNLKQPQFSSNHYLNFQKSHPNSPREVVVKEAEEKRSTNPSR